MPEIIAKICDKITEYSFYALFFFVPLVFTSTTSELFELNKMWITFGLTLFVFSSFVVKSIVKKEFRIQKTPFDIPILLFLVSQILSTLFSWDKHVSIWGYYSRFNGGLLSTVSYITLYYAFVSYITENKNNSSDQQNLPFFLRFLFFAAGSILIIAGVLFSSPPTSDPTGGNQIVFFIFLFLSFFFFTASFPKGFIKRVILVNILTGAIVALWGLPSHFGYDPTCLLFRGKFDVSCWTDAFQPKIRIFSTLGQPNWLAAYLSVLIPLVLAFVFNNQESKTQTQKKVSSITHYVLSKKFLHTTCYILLATLFYVNIIFTDARSGLLGLACGLVIFFTGVILVFKKRIHQYAFSLSTIVLLFLIATFFFGSPIGFLRQYTYPKLFQHTAARKQLEQNGKTEPVANGPALETGGTESGAIRLNVWKGAIDAWRENFLFGTGVETFAFAYYKYRPVTHNLTSEWDFLYNKAHNEYLNYLATTGIFGFLTYISFIGLFLWYTFRILTKNSPNRLLILALLGGYVSILVSNFFGFSVVIVNVYLFLIPAFVLSLCNALDEKNSFGFIYKQSKTQKGSVSKGELAGIFVILLTLGYSIFLLYQFWKADIAYALGYNLDRIGSYERAYPKLHEAVQLRGDEPTFKDELTINDAYLAVAFAKQQDATSASILANEALLVSNDLFNQYPNNIVFLKTRVRTLSNLSQLDSRYAQNALETLIQAGDLAPTDAKIWYNLGILYGQTGNQEKAIAAFEKTIKLRPVYVDAYYALGLYYHDISTDDKGKVTKPEFHQKAVEEMKYIIKNFPANKKAAQDALKAWGEIF